MANLLTERQGYNVELLFLLCEGLPNVKTIEPIARLLAQEGFHPSMSRGGDPILPAPNAEAVVLDNFLDYEAKFSGKLPPGVSTIQFTGFPLFMDNFSNDTTNCSFAWRLLTGGFTRLSLSGLLFAIPENQAQYHEPLAQKMLDIAIKLYPLARPTYGFMEDSEVAHHPSGHEKIARQQKIVTLSWVDFFGPEYVAKYGREMLAGIPGWRVEDLPDGGLFYQSRPSIVVDDMRTYKQWQREAAAYLAGYGIKIRFPDPQLAKM
jgi:hypothetical protein